jgi:hypothetical protein
MLYDKIKKHNVKVWLVNTGYVFIFILDGLMENMVMDIESVFKILKKYSILSIMVN